MAPPSVYLGAAPGGDEGDDAGGDGHGDDVVECGAEGLEDVEGGEDEDGEEEGVVVEDGEGGRLVLGHLSRKHLGLNCAKLILQLDNLKRHYDNL